MVDQAIKGRTTLLFGFIEKQFSPREAFFRPIFFAIVVFFDSNVPVRNDYPGRLFKENVMANKLRFTRRNSAFDQKAVEKILTPNGEA